MVQKAYLDLDLVEGLAVVHANDGTDHLGYDDHVTQVGADGLGLLALISLALLRNKTGAC